MYQIIGLSGISNGGKSTIASTLIASFPHSYVISQDDFYKPEEEVCIDPTTNLQLWDELSALYTEQLIEAVKSWTLDPQKSCSYCQKVKENWCTGDIVHLLIIEGTLVYNLKPLNDMFNLRYFLTLPKEEAKKRRAKRDDYIPPDDSHFFDDHVWPMYEKNKRELDQLNIPYEELTGMAPISDNFKIISESVAKLLKRSPTIIIGIGGPTCSGKSTAAKLLMKRLDHAHCIGQDDYFKTKPDIPVDPNTKIKLWDDLAALNWDKMVADVIKWAQDPCSFCQKCSSSKQFSSLHVLIIEGTLIFNHGLLKELINKKYYLTLPYEECKRRRIGRVYGKDGYITPEDNFDGYVWPRHIHFRHQIEEENMEINWYDGLKDHEEMIKAILKDVSFSTKFIGYNNL